MCSPHAAGFHVLTSVCEIAFDAASRLQPDRLTLFVIMCVCVCVCGCGCGCVCGCGCAGPVSALLAFLRSRLPTPDLQQDASHGTGSVHGSAHRTSLSQQQQNQQTVTSGNVFGVDPHQLAAETAKRLVLAEKVRSSLHVHTHTHTHTMCLLSMRRCYDSSERQIECTDTEYTQKKLRGHKLCQRRDVRRCVYICVRDICVQVDLCFGGYTERPCKCRQALGACQCFQQLYVCVSVRLQNGHASAPPPNQAKPHATTGRTHTPAPAPYATAPTSDTAVAAAGARSGAGERVPGVAVARGVAELSLARMQLTRVPGEVWEALPGLTKLDLSGNQVSALQNEAQTIVRFAHK